MIALYATRYWKLALGGLILILILAWALRLDSLRARYKGALDLMAEQAQGVVVALREASDNPKVDWSTARGQVVALGESNRQLKGAIEKQNAAVDEWAREAAAAQADAATWRRIADKAQAQRRSALRTLSQAAVTPGTRGDCLVLLREAEEALDLAREAGA